MNRVCFPKEKLQNSHKNGGEINELFVLALSLVWFAGATLGWYGALEMDSEMVVDVFGVVPYAGCVDFLVPGAWCCWCPNFQLRRGAPRGALELACASWPYGHSLGSTVSAR